MGTHEPSHTHPHHPPRAPWHLGGAGSGIAAAILFGASPPLAKTLLPGMDVLVLSSLLYLGAGLAVALAMVLRAQASAPQEAPLKTADLPTLLGMALFGGLVGPVLMLVGLQRVSGVAGALLLNLEGPLTLLLAVAVLHEHLGLRVGLATLPIFAGAVILGAGTGELGGSPTGVMAIAGACLAWAIDNNLSQRLAARDPLAVVRIKALSAGSFAALIALGSGARWPALTHAFGALALGAASYGASLVLNLRAVRELGVARQALLFATAPFVGALLAIPILSEVPSPYQLIAGALMVAGVAALLREQHQHRHTHDALEHDHLHVHDEHHQHSHAERAGSEPHSHPHHHEGLEHEHPHTPDLHHRHVHR